MTKRSIFFVFCVLLASAFQRVFSQSEQNIRIQSSDQDFNLAATLMIPDNDSLIGAVILVSVAGPTDRDLSLGTHKYFKELADGLAANGIASIRYDDRGVGESGGDLNQTTLKQRTMDACNVMEQLRQEFPEVNSFGFIGMSEGAGIAVKSTELCPGASFIVMLSPPVRKGKVEMKNQMKRLLATSYFSEEQKIEIEKEGHRFLELVSSKNPEKNQDEILEIMKGKYGGVILPPYQFVPKSPEDKTDFVLSPWYQSQVNYDVREPISKLDTPALAIYGSLDMAIDPIANSDTLKGLNRDIHIIRMDGINHLMQEANTGSPLEYVFLPAGFSDKVIQKITEWMIRID